MARDPTFYKTLFGLVSLGLVFFIIERLVARGRKQPLLRKGWLTDVIYFLSTPFLTKPITTAFFILPVGILIAMNITTKEMLQLGQYRGFGPIGGQPLWLQAIEIYALGDLIAYWTHRLFHSGRMWNFHAVHHSSEDLDWLGSVRVHPVNDLINKLFQVSPLLLLGFNPTVTASSAVFFTLYAIFLHANVNWDFGPLRCVIATPVFHRWHHSKDREAWDKNFAGLLPIWDIVFGTYYMPKGRYPENFGIDDEMPNGFFGQLWMPFSKLLGRAGKKE
jgi:sterol desaturase/sphingolipid hydroxylase (fatty acid hydroxylase superfamily)